MLYSKVMAPRDGKYIVPSCVSQVLWSFCWYSLDVSKVRICESSRTTYLTVLILLINWLCHFEALTFD